MVAPVWYCAMARVEMAVRARMRFPQWISGWAHKTRCQGTPQGPGRPVSTLLSRVAFGRPLPGPPQSTLESGVRAIFFYFLSSAHRAPNETRQTPVEAVLRDPTRTSGHHFPGSHSKIHVGKEMWYAIAPLRFTTNDILGEAHQFVRDRTCATSSSSQRRCQRWQ